MVIRQEQGLCRNRGCQGNDTCQRHPGTGEYNINLGTSGWVAAVSNRRMESEGGGFNLAAMQKDLLINVVPFLNGGNAHRLIAKILSRNPDGAPDFEYISELLEKAEPGSHGLFFPALCGR